MPNVPVVKPYLPNREKYERYIKRIFQSGCLTNRGPLVQELETRLQDYLQVRNVICVSNCTLGLQVLFSALELNGDVVTTPFSFVATKSSLEWEGLRPIFADINPNSWNLSPDLVEAKIDANTSALLGVHVYGNPCDVADLQSISERHSVPVIYDAAHAFGVKTDGESVLSWGDGSVLSFHATKLFHTVEGGAVIVQNDDIADKVRSLISFGSVPQSGGTKLGINAKMSEFHAAMGLAVLDDINKIISERKEYYLQYTESLKSAFQLQRIESTTTHNYAYFPIVFPTEEKLLACEEKLNKSLIFPRRYFYPSLEHGNQSGQIECKVGFDIAKRVLCLPIYPGLGERDVSRICEIVAKFGI